MQFDFSQVLDKIENLEASLDKSTKQNNDHIANIGRIFYSAYESGSEITQKAKKGTNEFLEEIAIIYSEDGNFTKELLEKALNDEAGADKTEVKKDGEKLKVTFKETGNEYTVEVTNKN